jgi:type I restriction enzyme M protein
MINRRNRTLTDVDVNKIATTYHEWKRKNGNYQDIKGFCKSATLEDIEKHKFVLTPGRYVGIPDEVEDDITFEEKMELLTAELSLQMRESEILDKEIKLQFEKVGFEL